MKRKTNYMARESATRIEGQGLEVRPENNTEIPRLTKIIRSGIRFVS